MTITSKTQEARFVNTDTARDICRRVYDLPLSRQTFYRAINSGQLPSIRHCGRRLIRVADLERWIEHPQASVAPGTDEEGSR